MNKERLELIRNTIKDLENNHIYLIDMIIVNEIDWQLEKELTIENYDKLYNEIEYAYRKLEGVDIYTIVKCAIDNIDKILNDDESFSLREEACCY